VCLNSSVFNVDMGCFQTEADVVVLMALASVAIAVWTALVPQYAFISFTAAILYYYAAAWMLRPLCEWRRYYYAVFAAGAAASVASYIYALVAIRHMASGDKVIFGRAAGPGEYEFWMAVQFLSVFFTVLLKSAAYAFALKSMRPSKEHPPNKYPPLPTSETDIDRSVEMLAAADDFCSTKVPHGGLQRLICQGDVSAADDLPSYALIVAAYYAVFRRDLNLAEQLLGIIKGRFLSFEEESAAKVLEAARKAMATCDAQAVCGVAATGWAALFKELAALHFAYDAEAAKRLKCKTAKAFEWYDVYTKKRHYVRYIPNPRLYFIFHAADRVLPVCQPQK